MIDEAHKQFLLGPAGADKIRHSGRTLYEHLVGTHDLLQAWGNSKPVCDAGLFHSIYGTKHFKRQTWPLSDRETIRGLIGRDAEALAHAFCTVDRPRVFLAKPEGPFWKILRDLREIEAANLLEQGSKSRWLEQLLESDVSRGAKQAIEYWLKGEPAGASSPILPRHCRAPPRPAMPRSAGTDARKGSFDK
jgi:Domain of unknown function (DUF6817)